MYNEVGLETLETPILILLTQTQKFLRQDPRDRVFFLMGLLPASEAPVSTIDYSLSCEYIYTEFARNRMGRDSTRFICLSYARRQAALSALNLHGY